MIKALNILFFVGITGIMQNVFPLPGGNAAVIAFPELYINGNYDLFSLQNPTIK
jgi:hypothetical protein